jgi:hypothetical protein
VNTTTLAFFSKSMPQESFQRIAPLNSLICIPLEDELEESLQQQQQQQTAFAIVGPVDIVCSQQLEYDALIDIVGGGGGGESAWSELLEDNQQTPTSMPMSTQDIKLYGGAGGCGGSILRNIFVPRNSRISFRIGSGGDAGGEERQKDASVINQPSSSSSSSRAGHAGKATTLQCAGNFYAASGGRGGDSASNTGSTCTSICATNTRTSTPTSFMQSTPPPPLFFESFHHCAPVPVVPMDSRVGGKGGSYCAFPVTSDKTSLSATTTTATDSDVTPAPSAVVVTASLGEAGQDCILSSQCFYTGGDSQGILSVLDSKSGDKTILVGAAGGGGGAGLLSAGANASNYYSISETFCYSGAGGAGASIAIANDGKLKLASPTSGGNGCIVVRPYAPRVE